MLSPRTMLSGSWGHKKLFQHWKKDSNVFVSIVVPLEDKRMKSIGYPGTTIGKYLIFEREINENRKINLIFVNEKLGF